MTFISTDVNIFQLFILTSGSRQTKTLPTIDECRSKNDRNSVFNCHLSPVGRQMAIKNTVSIVFVCLI